MIIYKITNTENGKIYIGKSTTDIDTRWELHLKHAFNEERRTRFCNALRKYGPDVFSREVLVNNITSTDLLNEEEIHHIKTADSTKTEIGYNMSTGGDGGFTEEMRRRAAEVRKQSGISPEHIQALVTGRRKAGYSPLTEEQRQHISASVKRYYQDHPEHRARISEINKNKAKCGQDHPMWGKHHTSFALQKMSSAKKGKTYEEIFGETNAMQRKEKLRQQTGSKNPNYVDIDLHLLECLVENPRVTRKELCSVLLCSGPTLTNRFKILLEVDNLQRFRHNKPNEELLTFFTEKLNVFFHTT